MGKRHFNEEWLKKPDANGQAISLWCIKKDNFTATCKLCNIHINIAHMGYSTLKQHSEKKKHKGFSSTLQKVSNKVNVEEADKPKCTDRKCYKTFLLSQVPGPLKLQNQVWKLVTLLKTLVHLHLKLQSQKLCGHFPS